VPTRRKWPIVYEADPGAARLPLPATYRRREPEHTVLYRVVQDHLQTFLAQARDQNPNGCGMPSFIEREFTRYLECGVLAGNGFVRVHCDDCGHDRLVAFSCKNRAVCPSCSTRRMHDFSAHLVDRVFPRNLPVRQWVLALPRWVRFKLAYQPKLVTQVLQMFLRVIFAWQRRCARHRGFRDGCPGAVTVVQRFGSAINLNVHMHVLVPDGVFVERGEAAEFVALKAPTDTEVEAIARKVARRVLALVERCEENTETIVDESADPYAQSVLESQRKTVLATDGNDPPIKRGRRSAFLQGFSIHANVSVGAKKRDALEKLARYCARPPIALSRLSASADGARLSYRLKHRAPGTPELLYLTPLELLEKLSAIIPPPRVHVFRYHGCFAPNSKMRSRVVPCAAFSPSASSAAIGQSPEIGPRVDLTWTPPRPCRLDWASLLARVFKIDVLRCDRCGGRMRVLAFITDPDVTRAILTCLGLPTVAPAAKPARDHPRFELPEGFERDALEPAAQDGVDFIPNDDA
jgi:hypothetical protein